jgi:glutathione S-transferase
MTRKIGAQGKARAKGSAAPGRGKADRPARAAATAIPHKAGRKSEPMAEKKPPAGDVAERNVDQIRDILFGGQMRDYERRFHEHAQKLEQEAGRLRSEMEKRLLALEKRLDDQVDKLGKAVRQEVGDRGKAVEELEARTLQAARSARAEINGAIDQLRHEQSAGDERARKAVAELGASLKAASASAEAALVAARKELRGEKLSRGDFAALLTEMALRIKGEFELPTKK